MAKINFGGVEETVVTREEFPLEKAKEVLKNETIAVIGYGIQGPGQGLNLRDNGFNVIVGQRKESKTWDKAVADGWIPGETLFDIEEAAERATIIEYLLSDAAQIEVWPRLKKHLTAGKALYFSHGFAITYKERTGIVPPADVDVIMVAPKGSGTSLRRLFVQGRGINSSFAVFQDATGRAKERCLALGIGIGSGYMFETDFKREVYSDLTGERGTLMGAIQGIFAAQYDTLRAHGHTPSEGTGCMPTAPPQRNAAPLTGGRNSATLPALCSRICTTKWNRATRHNAQSTPTASQATAKACRKSCRNCTTARCGAQEMLSANFALKTISQPL